MRWANRDLRVARQFYAACAAALGLATIDNPAFVLDPDGNNIEAGCRR